MNFQIKNLHGKDIAVTDLDLALMQADDYRHYRLAEPTKSDLQRYASWKDMYEKLLTLKINVS